MIEMSSCLNSKPSISSKWKDLQICSNLGSTVLKAVYGNTPTPFKHDQYQAKIAKYQEETGKRLGIRSELVMYNALDIQHYMGSRQQRQSGSREIMFGREQTVPGTKYDYRWLTQTGEFTSAMLGYIMQIIRCNYNWLPRAKHFVLEEQGVDSYVSMVELFWPEIMHTSGYAGPPMDYEGRALRSQLEPWKMCEYDSKNKLLGFIEVRESTFIAHCVRAEHNLGDTECTMVRSRRAGKVRGQGRPLGLMAAWLLAQDKHKCRHSHGQAKQCLSRIRAVVERHEARRWLMQQQGSHHLFKAEAPSPPGDNWANG